MTTINHSANRRPTKRPAAVSGGFMGKLMRAATGAVLMAKLAAASRTVEGWIIGIWDRVGRLIAQRTGWAWPRRGGSGVEYRARSVEAAAEMATERPGRQTGSAQTQGSAWFAPDPPAKPHRERARRSPCDRKQQHRDKRERAPTKARQEVPERLWSFLARRFPRLTAMASAGAAKASRSGGQRQSRGSFEREGDAGPSRRPESSRPRQTRKAQPSRNGSARAGEPRSATAPKVAAAASAPQRPRAAPESRIWLVTEDPMRLGCLEPGACRKGDLVWRDVAGRHVFAVSYESKMIDPAHVLFRLWFQIFDPQTGYRRVIHQQLWLVKMPDSTWQFLSNSGRTSRELFLRRGGDRFKFPPVPRPRPARERPRERAQPRKPTAAKIPPPRIHIDELFAIGVLEPGELRNGDLLVRVGSDTFPLRYDADLFDPANAHLWLHGPIRDKLIHQKVVLARGDKRWWAKEQGRIGVELTLRGDRFQIPRPPRFASKPPCIPPQQPAPPCGANMPSAPPQEPTLPDGTDIPSAPIRDGGDSPLPNSASAPRTGWFRSNFADAKRIVMPFDAGIFERLWTAAMRLVWRLGIFDRSRPAV